MLKDYTAVNRHNEVLCSRIRRTHLELPAGCSSDSTNTSPCFSGIRSFPSCCLLILPGALTPFDQDGSLIGPRTFGLTERLVGQRSDGVSWCCNDKAEINDTTIASRKLQGLVFGEFLELDTF